MGEEAPGANAADEPRGTDDDSRKASNASHASQCRVAWASTQACISTRVHPYHAARSAMTELGHGAWKRSSTRLSLDADHRRYDANRFVTSASHACTDFGSSAWKSRWWLFW